MAGDLARRHAALVEYLRCKTDEHDWHAVSDAANDLRVLEAAMADGGPCKVKGCRTCGDVEIPPCGGFPDCKNPPAYYCELYKSSRCLVHSRGLCSWCRPL